MAAGFSKGKNPENRTPFTKNFFRFDDFAAYTTIINRKKPATETVYIRFFSRNTKPKSAFDALFGQHYKTAYAPPVPLPGSIQNLRTAFTLWQAHCCPIAFQYDTAGAP